MSILSILEDASAELSLGEVSSVFGGGTEQERHLLRLLKAECKALSERDWAVATKEYSFTTGATEKQEYGVPSDFKRLLVDTMMNRTQNKRVMCGLTPEEWQSMKSSVSVGVWPYARFIEGFLHFYPAPAAGETVAYEYISRNIFKGADGVYKQDAQYDSDIPIFDEELVTLGVIWRFKQARSMDFEGDYSKYRALLLSLFGRDGEPRVIPLSGQPQDRYPYPPIVPDTIPYG